MEMKKILAVGIIFLFIGVAIAPSINQSIVKASTDDDLVEVTTQACGIQGYGDTTVKLTKEQYQNLEQYLVEFRARLNQTTSREEAVPIFKDAVVELSKYGLLPKGMSVERAQRLVVSGYQNQYRFQHLRKMNDHNTLNQTYIDNVLCLIAGSTSNNHFIGPISIITFFIRFLISCILGVDFYDNPFEIGGFGLFGGAYRVGLDDVVFVPSNGWVKSLGLQGAQSINGSFYGTITGFAWLWTVNFYLGVTGFIGLIIGVSNDRFFLGSAYRIGLSTNH